MCCGGRSSPPWQPLLGAQVETSGTQGSPPGGNGTVARPRCNESRSIVPLRAFVVSLPTWHQSLAIVCCCCFVFCEKQTTPRHWLPRPAHSPESQDRQVLISSPRRPHRHGTGWHRPSAAVTPVSAGLRRLPHPPEALPKTAVCRRTLAWHSASVSLRDAVRGEAAQEREGSGEAAGKDDSHAGRCGGEKAGHRRRSNGLYLGPRSHGNPRAESSKERMDGNAPRVATLGSVDAAGAYSSCAQAAMKAPACETEPREKRGSVQCPLLRD